MGSGGKSLSGSKVQGPRSKVQGPKPKVQSPRSKAQGQRSGTRKRFPFLIFWREADGGNGESHGWTIGYSFRDHFPKGSAGSGGKGWCRVSSSRFQVSG